MKALPAIDQPVIRPAHMCLALHCSEALVSRHISAGNIPRPDGRGTDNVKLWKRSTIRAWRPDIADAIDDLLKHPAFGPLPTYLPKAA